MLLTLRATKGMGNAALYVRFRDVLGRYWNLVTLAWDAAETANCRIFLTEYQDSDLLESRYQGTATLPTGDSTAEYVRLSDGRVLGEDGSGFTTGYISGSVQPVLNRIAGLVGANRAVDQEVMDADLRVVSARIRTYDTAANASSSGT